jgi:hypothetical protein
MHGASSRQCPGYTRSTVFQELKVERIAREAPETRTEGLSRFDLDVFLIMAERVAIRGLDSSVTDDASGQGHYLPSSDATRAEPFRGYRPAAPRTRRIECLAQAHREERERLQARVAELRTRPSASEADVASAEAALAELGDVPRLLTSDSDEQWHAARECDPLLL